MAEVDKTSSIVGQLMLQHQDLRAMLKNYTGVCEKLKTVVIHLQVRVKNAESLLDSILETGSVTDKHLEMIAQNKVDRDD